MQSIIGEEIDKMHDSLEDTIAIADNSFKSAARPTYMVSAMFSIFVLFFVGQESYHNLFPKAELSTLIIFDFIAMLLVMFIARSKFKIFTANPYVGLYLIVINTVIIFLPIDMSFLFFKEKYIINAAILLALFPFFTTTSLFFIEHFTLAYSVIKPYLKIRKKIKNIVEIVDQNKLSNSLFN